MLGVGAEYRQVLAGLPELTENPHPPFLFYSWLLDLDLKYLHKKTTIYRIGSQHKGWGEKKNKNVFLSQRQTFPGLDSDILFRYIFFKMEHGMEIALV